jgi:alpha-galactosidase
MKRLAILVVFTAGCLAQPRALTVRSSSAEFRVSSAGAISAVLWEHGDRRTILESAPDLGDRVWIDGEERPPAVYDLAHARRTSVRDSKGRPVQQLILESAPAPIRTTLTLEVSESTPSLAAVTITYRNTGPSPVRLDKVEALRHRVNASLSTPTAQPFETWTFQGAARKWGEGEVFAVDKSFQRPNTMNSEQGPEGEGGGLPVVAFWTRHVGIAAGHLEKTPLVLSLPTRVAPDGRIETSLVAEPHLTLEPGAAYTGPRSFLSIYRGDYYEALRAYSLAAGYQPEPPNRQSYHASWCGWGFGFGVTPAMMLGAIPKLKEFHLDWATLDDGWFSTYGDWLPRPETFPAASLQSMVEQFHRQGIRVQLWWYPLGVEDGEGRYDSHAYRVSNVVAGHPDWLILDANGKHARFGRNLAVLCPALPEVQAYHRELTRRFLRDWGFDGNKLDVVYSVPPCYNPAHHHKSPQESIQQIGAVYKAIAETSKSLKPDSVTQICPCGTTPNTGWLEFMNQAVAGDPVGSAQIRTRIKMYKALLGPTAAVAGDHVEYSADQFTGTDFASTVGLGGIPGSRFTWPGFGTQRNNQLSDAKSELFGKWFHLYEEKGLGDGVFRNLYVHGYDTPEGYSVEKAGRFYFAFFAPGRAKREMELRGLPPGRYNVVDYVTNHQLGVVDAKAPRLSAEFEDSLLIEVRKTQ